MHIGCIVVTNQIFCYGVKIRFIIHVIKNKQSTFISQDLRQEPDSIPLVTLYTCKCQEQKVPLFPIEILQNDKGVRRLGSVNFFS